MKAVIKKTLLAACVGAILPPMAGCSRKTTLDSRASMAYAGEREIRRLDSLSVVAALGITLKEPRIIMSHSSGSDTTHVEIRASEIMLGASQKLVSASVTADSAGVRTVSEITEMSRSDSGAGCRSWQWLTAIFAVLAIGLTLRGIDSRR